MVERSIPKPIRKLIFLTEDQAKKIARFRWATRLPSENEAIRRLIELGLESMDNPNAR